jgi:hypothetical protein
MDIVQWIKCRFGLHSRNGYRVRWRDGKRYSVCKGCKRRMVREQEGWQLLVVRDEVQG